MWVMNTGNLAGITQILRGFGSQRGLRSWRGAAGRAAAGVTAVCWNAALEQCQEEVVLWSSITTLQLLPR